MRANLSCRLRDFCGSATGQRHQIPLLLEAYRSGRLKLAELVTPYRLDEINQGYQDMRDGKNLRGVIRYTDADY